MPILHWNYARWNDLLNVGEPVYSPQYRDFLQFRAEYDTWGISDAQAAVLPACAQTMSNIFNSRGQQALDYVLDLYWRTDFVPYGDNTDVRYQQFSQFLLRRENKGWDSNGIYQEKPLWLSPNHLLERVLILPKAGDEAFETTLGIDTSAAMVELFNQAKISNPVALDRVILGTVAAGGIPALPTMSYRRQNLLTALQDLRASAMYAFVHTGAPVTPIEWRLRWDRANFVWHFDVGRFGVDRRDTVFLNVQRGTARSSYSDSNRTKEKTQFLVGGKGTGAARDIQTFTDARASDSAWNTIQAFINGSQGSAGDLAELDQVAQSATRRYGEKETFTIVLNETPSLRIGIDINPFDFVRATINNATIEDLQVSGLGTTVDPRLGTQIAVSFTRLDASEFGGQSAVGELIRFGLELGSPTATSQLKRDVIQLDERQSYDEAAT